LRGEPVAEQHRFAMITLSSRISSFGWLANEKVLRCTFAVLGIDVPLDSTFGQQTSFKVLAFYSTKVEPDHVLFAEGALKFFSGLSAKKNFTFDSTSNWDDTNDFNLGKYQVVVWLNDDLQKPSKGVPFKNTLKTEARGWASCAAYNDKIPTGRGLWISSVAASSTATAGLHCLRSSPSMIIHIR